MTQLDVFDNPIARARRAYPFVVVLQADLAGTGRDRIVAPLVPRARLPGTTGRLTPHVTVCDVEHVVLIPSLTGVAVADLHDVRDRLLAYRDEIVAAVDFLFLGA